MKKASLLWVDLEMTGLDPKEDAILEVAAIATNYDFKPIATYEGIVKVDEKELVDMKIPMGKDNFGENIYWNLDNESTPNKFTIGSVGSGKSVSILSDLEYVLFNSLNNLSISPCLSLESISI